MPLSLTRILFVDGSATSPTADGSLDKPYQSIQAAVGAVQVPATVAESLQEWMILIAPGDYDEDVTISGPVRLAFIGLGAFRLGRYTAAGGTQTNIVAVAGAMPRNLVWSYEIGQVISDGAAPQLVIGTIGGGCRAPW
jgi:pectin methylesterase-like acyl-CoA thioesterase